MKLRSLIEQELDYPIKKKVGFARSGELNTDFGRSISDFYRFYKNPNLDDKPEGLFTDMSMAIYEKFPETGEQLANINDLAMDFYKNIGDPKAKDLPGNYDVRADETVAEYLFSKINLINITSKDIISQIEENGDFKALDLQRIEDALEEMNQKIQGPAPKTDMEPVGFKMMREFIRKVIKEQEKISLSQFTSADAKEIEKTAFADGILLQVSDDDYYTLSEKKVMWKRQDGICPCDREDCDRNIPLEEIGNGSKWHGDAKLPRGKGYLHTLDNGQLMCSIGNIKKSDKIGKFVL